MNNEPMREKIVRYLVSTINGLFHFKDSSWNLINEG